MLNKILNTLQQTSGPVSLRELSRKLNIDANALSGMIEVLVQKGKLSVDDDPHSNHNGPSICSCGNNGDVMDCPYIAPMPTMYSIRK